MLQERYDLEKKLDGVLEEYNPNKKMRDVLKTQLGKHGILNSEFQQVWLRNTSLDGVELPLIYLLTKYLYERTGESSIETSKYFTETEIKDGDIYVREVVDETLEYPITFEDVLRCREDQYNFYLSIQQIKKLLDSKIITYNFDTQRSPKHKVNNDGGLIKVININRQAVKEITKDLLENNFITNCITFNLLQDGKDSFVYNEKKNELTILSGEVNVIDGFHRCLSMINALSINPNLEYITEVRFTNWGVEKCRNFIFQEDKKNKINKRYIQSVVNTGKWGNKVIGKLNDGNGDLKGKITTDFALVKINKAFTMFDFMSNAVDTLWDIKTNMDVSNLSNYLTDFFDHIIGYKAEDFVEDVGKSREKSVVTMPAMFIGYLSLAKKLQDDPNKYEKLEAFLNKTDFNIESQEWLKLNIINRSKKPTITLNKSNVKNIINYFNELV